MYKSIFVNSNPCPPPPPHFCHYPTHISVKIIKAESSL